MEISKKDQQARAKWEYKGGTRPSFADNTKPGQESVWDYPRPPKLVPDQRRVRVLVGTEVIADSIEVVRVLETASPPTFYVPPKDVAISLLVATDRVTHCEWKGRAREYVVAGVPGAGWSYFDTIAEFDSLKGYFAFYPSKVSCFVDQERVIPQPGGYYGGWITKEIVGPFKSGDKQTAGW